MRLRLFILRPAVLFTAQRSKDPADNAAVLESHMSGLHRSCVLGFRLQVAM
jgi:hypothetical protein